MNAAAAEDEVYEVLTRDELLQRIEDEAQEMLGISREAAFKKLDSGELRGTIAAAELEGLRLLLDY